MHTRGLGHKEVPFRSIMTPADQLEISQSQPDILLVTGFTDYTRKEGVAARSALSH